MLTVWAEERDTRERLVNAASAEGAVRSCGRWEEFRSSLEKADCAVVAARPSGGQLIADLQLLEDRHGGADGGRPALVLCLPRTSRTLRRLKDAAADEVVWLDEVEAELPLAIRRGRAECRFREFRRRIADCEHLSPTLARAIGRALSRQPPVTSVQHLAEEVERDRRTLWHHWNRAVEDSEDLTLKAFLDWVVLLRAAVERSGSESWEEVAHEFGVHARTLRRTARRRTEDRLGRLANGGLEACFRCFEEEVLPRVTGSAAEAPGRQDQTPRA